MKKYSFLLGGFLFLQACSNDRTTGEVTKEEKAELKKVETFKKTDKQKEDSVLAKWQKKMEKSTVGEE
jgi:PBP1b-binding outer membrane lipoprotein LpoB